MNVSAQCVTTLDWSDFKGDTVAGIFRTIFDPGPILVEDDRFHDIDTPITEDFVTLDLYLIDEDTIRNILRGDKMGKTAKLSLARL